MSLIKPRTARKIIKMTNPLGIDYGKDLDLWYDTDMKTYVSTTIDTHALPLHPEYAALMNPELEIGDLVETYDGKIGLITVLMIAQICM